MSSLSWSRTALEHCLSTSVSRLSESTVGFHEERKGKEMTEDAHNDLFQKDPLNASSLGGSASFDANTFRVVPPRTFDELKIGEVFRAPSRTLTDAHSAAFQTVSADNHPIHYDVEWARKHGHSAPLVHGLQVLMFTVPGATLFPHVIGESFLAFTELSCTFLKEVHVGDTLYPALTIIGLVPDGDTGTVVIAATIHNQRGELVLSGEQKFLLRRVL